MARGVVEDCSTRDEEGSWYSLGQVPPKKDQRKQGSRTQEELAEDTETSLAYFPFPIELSKNSRKRERE